jgi:hypothetical protein
LPGQAIVESDARLPAEVTQELRCIGNRAALVAGTGWLPFDDWFAAEDALQLG